MSPALTQGLLGVPQGQAQGRGFATNQPAGLGGHSLYLLHHTHTMKGSSALLTEGLSARAPCMLVWPSTALSPSWGFRAPHLLDTSRKEQAPRPPCQKQPHSSPIPHPSAIHVLSYPLLGTLKPVRGRGCGLREAEYQERGTARAPPKKEEAYHGIKPTLPRAQGRQGRD